MAEELHAISIPGETATLSAEETEAAARDVGIPARTAETARAAVERIAQANPHARILVCGSLYLAGNVLRENG